MAKRRGCRTVCDNTCAKAHDSQCSDGWLGDDSPEGKASCNLGTDCADCGARDVCPVAGTSSLMLPHDVLLPAAAMLRASQVLFVILGSSKFVPKSKRAYSSWCRSVRSVRCLFVADDDPPLDKASVADDPMPWLTVGSSQPPRHCCEKKPGSQRRNSGFFCTPHRLKTLRAQYRFLPALLHVQYSAALRSDAFQWIVLVDDDAFVFVPRLLWILSRLDSSRAIYAGDFGSSGEATAIGIPHFACGGGGSVLSVAALRRMNISDCLASYHVRCMQSDWMIGGCVRRHQVAELRDLGCGTCDPKRLKEEAYRASVRQRLKDDRCFFMQNAVPFARDLPLGRHSGAIVHGFDREATWGFFRKHNTTTSRVSLA